MSVDGRVRGLDVEQWLRLKVFGSLHNWAGQEWDM